MNKIFDLSGKTILVLGGSSGIGRCVAQTCSEFGARVIVHGRDNSRVQETLRLLKPNDHQFFCEDINSPSFEKNILEYLSIHSISGVFSSIGMHHFTPLKVLNLKMANQIIETNLISAVKIIKILSIIGKKNSSISSIFMSSVASISGDSGLSIYSASKAGLNGLVKASAKELAFLSVRINLILAGMVKTEMAEKIKNQLTEEQYLKIEMNHPLGLGLPEDIAYLTIYLLSDASRWVTGSSFLVDGGYSL